MTQPKNEKERTRTASELDVADTELVKRRIAIRDLVRKALSPWVSVSRIRLFKQDKERFVKRYIYDEKEEITSEAMERGKTIERLIHGTETAEGAESIRKQVLATGLPCPIIEPERVSFDPIDAPLIIPHKEETLFQQPYNPVIPTMLRVVPDALTDTHIFEFKHCFRDRVKDNLQKALEQIRYGQYAYRRVHGEKKEPIGIIVLLIRERGTTDYTNISVETIERPVMFQDDEIITKRLLEFSRELYHYFDTNFNKIAGGLQT